MCVGVRVRGCVRCVCVSECEGVCMCVRVSKVCLCEVE